MKTAALFLAAALLYAAATVGTLVLLTVEAR